MVDCHQGGHHSSGHHDHARLHNNKMAQDLK